MTRWTAFRRLPEAAPVQGLLSALLFLSSVWVAPLGFLLCVATPLPIALASWRKGPAGALTALPIAAAAVWASAGTEAALMYGVYFGLGAVALGLSVRAGKAPETVVGSYALLSVAAFWAVVSVEAAKAGTGPLALIAAGMKQSALQMKELLLSAQVGAEATTGIEEWARTFTRVFPGALVALTLLVGWVNGLALRKALTRGGNEVPRWNTWRAPEGWIWVLIASGLVAVLSDGRPATVALNVFIPALAVYFLQGLAVVQHLFETKAFPPALRGAAYLLLLLQLPAALLVAGLGAFDLWLDFRARWSNRPATGS